MFVPDPPRLRIWRLGWLVGVCAIVALLVAMAAPSRADAAAAQRPRLPDHLGLGARVFGKGGFVATAGFTHGFGDLVRLGLWDSLGAQRRLEARLVLGDQHRAEGETARLLADAQSGRIGRFAAPSAGGFDRVAPAYA